MSFRPKMSIRVSLFLKIYLTLLAALLILSLLFGSLWRFAIDRPDPADRFPRRIVEAIMPPPDAPLFQQRRSIQRIAEALDAEIILRGPDGQRLAFVGDPEAELRAGGLFGREKRAWRVKLSDGRMVIARFDAPLRPPGWRIISTLLLAAVAVAVAALPIIWLMTRRLERLRRSVEAFGQGALATRAEVKGSDEVTVLAKSFNDSAARIEALIASHRSLLANASHELRSPMTRLRLAIDLQSERPTEERKGEIIRNLEEMDQLIDEILLASRLDHAETVLTLLPLDLQPLAEEETGRHEARFLRSGAEPVMVKGDAVLLRRLLRNLIENALKHGAKPVEVSIDREDADAVLRVRDHGAGISPDERERIFDPFFRPARRSESGGGWGLGLSLARQIATRHGGTINCGEATGGGAEFTLRLPLNA
jgi:signal transduction histidine kinase